MILLSLDPLLRELHIQILRAAVIASDRFAENDFFVGDDSLQSRYSFGLASKLRTKTLGKIVLDDSVLFLLVELLAVELLNRNYILHIVLAGNVVR